MTKHRHQNQARSVEKTSALRQTLQERAQLLAPDSLLMYRNFNSAKLQQLLTLLRQKHEDEARNPYLLLAASEKNVPLTKDEKSVLSQWLQHNSYPTR